MGKHVPVEVRIVDANGKITERGRGEIRFLGNAIPQIHPSNLLDNQRNQNWQRISSSEAFGEKPDTLPLSLLMFKRTIDVPAQHLTKFNLGTRDAGVLPSSQLRALG